MRARANAAKTFQRSGWLAVLAAASTIGLAACSGGSASPQVASLGHSSGSSPGSGNSQSAGTSASAPPGGNPAQLLTEWTSCMRSHGDPNQAEPTVDASKAIRVNEPAGYYGTIDGPTGQNSSGAGVICQKYLTAASMALNGGQPLAQPDTVQMDKFAECMRANGVPSFTDPGAAPAGHQGSSGAPNPGSPIFQKASKLCGQKAGVPSLGDLQPGDIEIFLPNGQLGLVSF